MPDGTAYQFSFVMEAKSVITSPSGRRQIQPGFHEIQGLAWSGRGRIRTVEVSVDAGRTWQTAQLQEPVLPKCHTRFRIPWRWNKNVYA
jgi:sulfane dehydrogenase subunit SoxC